jgi:hypothetical protein
MLKNLAFLTGDENITVARLLKGIFWKNDERQKNRRTFGLVEIINYVRKKEGGENGKRKIKCHSNFTHTGNDTLEEYFDGVAYW